jgi:hypothetical protein
MSTLMMLGPVAAPALGAVAQAALGWGRVTSWISTLSASAALVAAIGTAIGVTSGGPRTAVAGLMRVDALSAFMLIVIAAAGVLATVATSAYLGVEIRAAHVSARTATRHSVLVQLFLASMALAVLAANLGLLWVAVEATTVVTAFLVGHQRSRAAVEAAWKYVVIWSTASRWHYWVRSCSTMPPSTPWSPRDWISPGWRRLVRYFRWLQGWYPMLREAGDPPAFGDVDGPYPFHSVEGRGVYENPVGPVYAGMIEPAHFLLRGRRDHPQSQGPPLAAPDGTRPGQDRRPQLLQLARPAGRPDRHDRARLPPDQ